MWDDGGPHEIPSRAAGWTALVYSYIQTRFSPEIVGIKNSCAFSYRPSLLKALTLRFVLDRLLKNIGATAFCQIAQEFVKALIAFDKKQKTSISNRALA